MPKAAEKATTRAYVYCITNTINGKRYVGVSMDPDRRWKQHQERANGKVGKRRRVHHAIIKYGLSAFKFEVILCSSTWESALAAETLIIAAYGTIEADFGYNLTEGGEGVLGLVHSAETRAKLSAIFKGVKKGPPSSAHREALRAAMSGRKPTEAVMSAALAANKGRKFTEAQRAARVVQLTGRPVSAETKEKIRLGNVGKKRTPEQCANNRAAQIGKRHTPEQSAAKSARQTGRTIVPWTDARRAALSAAQKGKPRGPRLVRLPIGF